MTDIVVQSIMPNVLGDNYKNELMAQCAMWERLQEERKIRETEELEKKLKYEKEYELAWMKVDKFDKIDEARRIAEKQVDKMTKEIIELKTRIDLWEKVVKICSEKNKKMEGMVKRRQKARIIEGELGFGSSMVAHRLWELTGMSDWAAIIRKEWFDGLDIMDMTIDDLKSISEVENAEELMDGIIQLRDVMTKPVAELIAVLHEKDDPITNWYEAQILLKIYLVKGIQCE